MKTIPLSELKELSAKRPLGFYQEVVSRGQIETAEVLVLDDATYQELQTKFAPPRPQREKLKPIPRKDWPIWAKGLAMISKPEDKGIGDVVARTMGAENSEAFKKWYKATTGKNCGCTGRQNLWNQEYPLNSKAT